jgi:outer membrane protein assembly factor BamE (lipoprotein component of BamABCDE complex)
MTTMLPQIIWLPFILLTCLSGCVATSELLSGPASVANSRPEPSSLREPIQIGVSTQEEVRGMLGNPTEGKTYSPNGTQLESWAYVSHEETVQPYQYVLFVGAFAFSRSHVNDSPSVAISFSPNGVVSGLTVSTLNAYGDIPPSELFPVSASSTTLYGMRNPQISHSPHATDSQIP